jgi:fumarate hydratase class I
MSEKPTTRLTLPLSEDEVKNLHTGDFVLLSGIVVTARDAAHKWLADTFIRGTAPPSNEDARVEKALASALKGGGIYHCGPVVSRQADGSYRFLAAGPTTSIREEPYQAEIIHQYGVRVIIGKGGMGEKTLQACREASALYLHATGGAAVLLAACVKEVRAVYKTEFGLPEAFWLIRVEDMPLVVSMDAHGHSLHEKIRENSQTRLLN